MPTQHYSDTRLWQWEEENQYDGLEHYNTWGCSDRVLLEFGVKSILEVVIVSALEKQSPALRTLSLCSWQTFQTSFAKCISSLSQRQCPDMLPLDFREDFIPSDFCKVCCATRRISIELHFQMFKDKYMRFCRLHLWLLTYGKNTKPLTKNKKIKN